MAESREPELGRPEAFTTAMLVATSWCGGPEWNQNLADHAGIAAILELEPDPDVRASKFLPTLRRADSLLRELNHSAPAGPVDGAGLAALYFVSGSVEQNDFSGCRAGRLSPKRREMVVNVAVPGEIAYSTDAGEVASYITESLVACIDFAEDHFPTRGVHADFSRVRAIAADASQRLMSEMSS